MNDWRAISTHTYTHYRAGLHTVKKEMKCSEDSEILHEIFCNTTRIISCFPIFVYYHELFRVVSRNPRSTLFPTVRPFSPSHTLLNSFLNIKHVSSLYCSGNYGENFHQCTYSPPEALEISMHFQSEARYIQMGWIIISDVI